MPYIKFSTMIKVWIINVFLDYVGSETIIFVLLTTFYPKSDVFKIMTNADTFTLITAFSRLNDPNIGY